MDYKKWKSAYFHTPGTVYAPHGLDSLRWHGGDSGSRDYVISDSSYEAFLRACTHSPDPTPPRRAPLAFVGRLSFQGFALHPDADWFPGRRNPGPIFLGEASALLQDPDPANPGSPFKKVWNHCAELCQCQLGVNVDVTLSKGLFASHRGIAALKLNHNFLLVSLFRASPFSFLTPYSSASVNH